MSNQEKNNLNIVTEEKPEVLGSIVIEDNDLPEYEPSAIELGNEGKITVLIKHDYYSSDSAHGRSLLHACLASLLRNNHAIRTLILVDSGVKLLDKSNEESELIEKLAEISSESYYCTASAEEYLAGDFDIISNLSGISEDSVFDLLALTTNLFVIE